MKKSELLKLSPEELKNKLRIEKESYSKLKFAHKITPIENPMKIKFSRKLIARINTVIRNKEIHQS